MALSVSVLKLRDFRLLLTVRAFIIMALMAQDVIVGWQVYSITKSVLMLGFIGLTEAIPAITCALFSGHFIDNGRPYFIFRTAFSVITLNSFIMLLFGGGIIPIHHHSVLIFLFFGIFVSGVVRSFLMPSAFALLSQVVPRSQISAASAWFTGMFQVAAISGPAIAGLIYGGYGVFYAWLMPFMLVSMGLIMVFRMNKKLKSYRSREKREKILTSIVTGWKFLARHNVLLTIMALDMFAVLFGGAVSMLPAFADQVLHTGSQDLGLLRAAPAMGSVVVAFFLALRPMKRVRGALMLPIVAAFGICIIAFGLSTTFPMAMLFLILSGAVDSVSMVVRSTLMQLLTPDDMRGRVSSIGSMFVISSNEIGAFESGVMAKFLGLVPSIIFGGCCTLVVVAATYFLSPQLRKTVINPEDHNKERG